MILEHAVLHIKPEEADTFEKTFQKAQTIISAMKGYIRHSVSKCMEEDYKYLLLVEWETIEDHEIGFRKSPEYQEWKALLHHFYDPFPIVQHYQPVLI